MCQHLPSNFVLHILYLFANKQRDTHLTLTSKHSYIYTQLRLNNSETTFLFPVCFCHFLHCCWLTSDYRFALYLHLYYRRIPCGFDAQVAIPENTAICFVHYCFDTNTQTAAYCYLRTLKCPFEYLFVALRRILHMLGMKSRRRVCIALAKKKIANELHVTHAY